MSEKIIVDHFFSFSVLESVVNKKYASADDRTVEMQSKTNFPLLFKF